MKRKVTVWVLLAFLGLSVVACQQGGSLENRVRELEIKVQTLQKDVEALKRQMSGFQAGESETPPVQKSAKETQGVKPRPPKKKGG